MPKTTALATAALLTTAALAGARAQPTRLAGRQLVETDLPVLEQALRALHPGLLRYNTPAELEGRFAALRKAWSRDQTLAEAYLSLSVFLAQLECGHTYANFFNQKNEVAAEVFGGQTRVPFQFRWLSERMVITRNLSESSELAPGTEVVAINGTPAAQVLARLMTIARADGSNDAKRRSLLEITGESSLETFDVFFPLFFPLRGPVFSLEIVPPGASAPRRVQVAAQTLDQRKALTPPDRHRGAEAAFTLAFLDDGTALVRMPSWALYDSKWDWKTWLQRMFDQLLEKKTAALIIDLRGNEGGLDVGDVVLAHLIDRELALDGYTRRVRYRKVPDSLLPYLDTWDKSFRDWGSDAFNPGGGYYDLKGGETAGPKVIHPLAPRFAGRVAVLVDASNSSATFQFDQAVQERHLAALVGEPTGGNQRGINGGAFFFLRLPYSRLEADLPLIGRFPSRPRPDAGLVPDELAGPAAMDIARGDDVALAAARRLLSGRR